MGNCISGVNGDPNCGLDALPAPGSTVYYAPGNCYPIEFQGTSTGTCTPLTCSGDVSLWQGGTQITDCGLISLDGNPHTLQCGRGDAPTYPLARGNIPAGVYSFIIPIQSQDGAPTRSLTDEFTIVHTQQIVTTTDTVEVTSTTTNTVTDPIPVFLTVTSPLQATVTTPAVTESPTITVTPTVSTVTTTKTKTYACYSDVWKFPRKTVTSTLPCPKPKPCTSNTNPKQQKKVGGRQAADAPRADALEPRQAPTCETHGPVTGDGPATLTVPADQPVVTTVTVTDPVNTVHEPSYYTTTQTVPPTPATVTVTSGTFTNLQTVTLPQVTTTFTAHTYTRVTATRTRRKTVTYTKKVTPTSCFKGQPHVKGG